jgi:hypothetical protein
VPERKSHDDQNAYCEKEQHTGEQEVPADNFFDRVNVQSNYGIILRGLWEGRKGKHAKHANG